MTYNFVTEDPAIRGKRSALQYIVESQLNPANDIEFEGDEDESPEDRMNPEEEYL